jgi:hypothetical protein
MTPDEMAEILQFYWAYVHPYSSFHR